MSGWFLLDRPNPTGPNYYSIRRTCRHGIQPVALPHLIVLHTAESIPDWDPPDDRAETVSRYAATTTRNVSWHHTTDSDSDIPMLPDSYTAWHVQNYNRCSWGVEMATRAALWWNAPTAWKNNILAVTAAVCRKVAVRNGIPVRLLSRAQADQGLRGFISHAALDPGRRSDPGAGFPWDDFLNRVGVTEESFLKRGDIGNAVRVVQKTLNAIGVYSYFQSEPLLVDGVFGDNTERAVKKYQELAGLPQTGDTSGDTGWLLGRYAAVIDPASDPGHTHDDLYAPRSHPHTVTIK